jgi:hypothetical protein
MSLPSLQDLQELYAGLLPWLALSLLLMGRNPYPSPTRFLFSLILSVLVLEIPVAGWSLFAWCRTLEINPSLTFTGLLAITAAGKLLRKRIFRTEDWKAAWITGAVASILLYPMALGLSRLDPYLLGWRWMLPVLIALTATILLIRGNRFGMILTLPLAGSLLHLEESTNLWDYLIDPFYEMTSLLFIIRLAIDRLRKNSRGLESRSQPATPSRHP